MTTKQKQIWQQALSHMITEPAELFDLLALDTAYLEKANAAVKMFPLKVTHSYLNRIEKNNLQDPLLKQILPLGAELQEVAGYVTDPLGEQQVNPVAGLLHKYEGRVLVTLTSACAIHCRYCFRRHFPYADNNPGRAGWQKILAYVAHDTSIEEIILSGGDPLSVSDELLAQFMTQVMQISHIKTLRIHTRLPIVLPQRVTSLLCDLLAETPLQVVMVVHCNHAQEIDSEVKAALFALKQAGVHLLNQSVLLKGVNDDAETLMTLSKTLFAAGVLPYYLHQLDKVAGAAHFAVDEAHARQLHQTITSKLSGYLVPKFVYERSGAPSKLPVLFA
jgi:EF-P beta-lysylation protein EpmB